MFGEAACLYAKGERRVRLSLLWDAMSAGREVGAVKIPRKFGSYASLLKHRFAPKDGLLHLFAAVMLDLADGLFSSARFLIYI